MDHQMDRDGRHGMLPRNKRESDTVRQKEEAGRICDPGIKETPGIETFINEFIDWLDQTEEETKATVRESGVMSDPFYDGTLSAIYQIREYVKKMRRINQAEGTKKNEETKQH